MFTLSTAETAQAQRLSEPELRTVIITRPKWLGIFLTLYLQNNDISKYFFSTQNLNETVPKSKLWSLQEQHRYWKIIYCNVLPPLSPHYLLNQIRTEKSLD